MHPTTIDVGRVGNQINRWLSSEVKTTSSDEIRVRTGLFNSTLITSGATSGNIKLKLPPVIGAANQVLTTDGLGVSRWDYATPIGGNFYTSMLQNTSSSFILNDVEFKCDINNGIQFRKVTGTALMTGQIAIIWAASNTFMNYYNTNVSQTYITNSFSGVSQAGTRFSLTLTDETNNKAYWVDITQKSITSNYTVKAQYW